MALPSIQELKARAVRLLKKSTVQPVANYFKPVAGSVRTRDIVRELPSQFTPQQMGQNLMSAPKFRFGENSSSIVKKAGGTVVNSLLNPFINVKDYAKEASNQHYGVAPRNTKKLAGMGISAALDLGTMGLGSNLATTAAKGALERVAPTTLKTLAPYLAKQAWKGSSLAGKIGAGYGFSGALTEDKGVLDTVKDTAYGYGAGRVLGSALGFGSAAAPALFKAGVGSLAGKMFRTADKYPYFTETSKQVGKGVKEFAKDIPRPGMSIKDVSGDIPPQFSPKTKTMMKEPSINDQPLLSGRTPIAGVNDARPSEIGKVRGLVQSVKDSENVSAVTKPLVEGTYTPKPNTTLMGEAKGLLEDGVEVNFKGVQDVDRKVAATIQEALNLDASGNPQAAANLFNNLAKYGTELGRGVQAFSLLHKMSPEAVALSLAGKINKYNRVHPDSPLPELSGDQVRSFGEQVKRIMAMPAGREKNIATNNLQRALDNVIPSTLADKIMTVWKAGLLTSLRTTGRNILGNTLQAGSEIVKDAPAVGMDKLLAAKTGKRTVTMTTRGTIAGTKGSLQKMKDVFNYGYDPEDTIGKYDVRNTTWGNNKVEQGLKWYTERVFRILGAQDIPFFNSSYARSLYSQAGAAAINAGHKGKAAKPFIETLVKNPTEEMKMLATQDASYATFKDKGKLGEMLSMIKTEARKAPGLWGQIGTVVTEATMPFTGVPSSIASKMIDYSPIGLGKSLYRAGQVINGKVNYQREAAQAFGRGVVGTALLAAGAKLMENGLMTGYPKSPEEARQWELEGKAPRSIYIGGKWRSINSVGPQAIIALAGGAIQNAKSGGEAALTIGKDYLNQTFLGGVQRPMQALVDPTRYGESYVQGQVGSVVPNFVKDVASSGDPYKREINSVGEALQYGVPGARNQLLPKRGVLGEPVKNDMSGFRAFVDVFNSKTPIHTPAIDELSRLNIVDMGATPGKIRETETIFGKKVTFTPQELDSLEQASGNALRPALENLVTSPGYSQLSDEDKQAMIGNLVKDIRSKAKNGMAIGSSSTGVGTGSSGFSGLDTQSIEKKYQEQIFKQKFEESDQVKAEFNGKVWRKDEFGVAHQISKGSYDSQLYTAKLDAAYDRDDIKGWFEIAQKQYQTLEARLSDPSLDELEIEKVQNQIRTLVKKASLYKRYGGFKKPKAPKKRKAIKLKTTSTTAMKARTRSNSAPQLYSKSKPSSSQQPVFTVGSGFKVR